MQLLDKLKDLIGIAERTRDLVSSLSIGYDDHPSLLAYTFLQRQYELACAVSTLADANSHASAALLARTMLEGAMKLHWALMGENGERRAKLWRALAWIEDLRELERQEQLGFPISEEQKAFFLERIEAFPELLGSSGRPHQSWTVNEAGSYRNMKDISDEYCLLHPSESINVHPLYARFSTYVHWSPASFNLNYSESNWLFSPVSESVTKAMLGLSIVSLGMVLSLVSIWFSLSTVEEVDRFMEEVSYE